MAFTTRGRFAPSPTGYLHLGHVSAALLSWLHCRLMCGEFILRLDDLDPIRCKPEYSAAILEDLRWLQLDWDIGPLYQSQRQPLYTDIFQQLLAEDKLYPCFCSRKDIQNASQANFANTAIYPGTCRNLSSGSRQNQLAKRSAAWRIRSQGQVQFLDLFCGRQSYNLQEDYGDFVVKRNDDSFAYHLACVVDDADLAVNQVTRGQDLLPMTAPQIYIYEQLAQKPPQYAHFSLILDENGRKLSKRHGSLSLAKMRGQYSAEELIGHIAYFYGLIAQERAISAKDLLHELHLDQFLGQLSQLRPYPYKL